VAADKVEAPQAPALKDEPPAPLAAPIEKVAVAAPAVPVAPVASSAPAESDGVRGTAADSAQPTEAPSPATPPSILPAAAANKPETQQENIADGIAREPAGLPPVVPSGPPPSESRHGSSTIGWIAGGMTAIGAAVAILVVRRRREGHQRPTVRWPTRPDTDDEDGIDLEGLYPRVVPEVVVEEIVFQEDEPAPLLLTTVEHDAELAALTAPASPAISGWRDPKHGASIVQLRRRAAESAAQN
jgi:hypothetical protein